MNFGRRRIDTTAAQNVTLENLNVAAFWLNQAPALQIKVGVNSVDPVQTYYGQVI